MPKTEIASTLNYSFGEITVKVGAGGKIDRPDQLLDHMMTTATAALGVESVLQGISEHHQNGSAAQECKVAMEIGDIKVSAEIGINANRHISNRKLNTILFGVVVPRIWETAALYLGENQIQTTPPAPLPARPHQEALNGLSDTLGLQKGHMTPSNLSEHREQFVGAGHQQ